MKAPGDESAAKLRGAYYTPPEIADYLTRWALQNRPARVLEPCCGDGAFLRAMANVRSDASNTYVVDAVELDATAAGLARAVEPALRSSGAVASVAHADFFAWIERQPASARWEAIVGNPPYVRYQYLSRTQRERSARLCAQAGVALSLRTNAWVPFMVVAISRLSPGGRLAMVIPAELLHVIHAHELRALLEREMSTITLLHLRRMAFAGALQGVVLLLATRRRPATEAALDDDRPVAGARLRMIDVVDVADLPPLDTLESTDETTASPARATAHRGGWMRALLHPREQSLLARVERQPWARAFTDLATVDIGIVTGANAFFLVDRETLARHDLTPYASPALGRSAHALGIEYSRADHRANDASGLPVHLLSIPAVPRNELAPAVRAYLASGERAGLHRRYKCRIRDPWWAVPYVWAAPIAMLKRAHEYTRLVANTCGAFSSDTAYRIRLARGMKTRRADVVFSFLNSFTLLLTETEGRSYAGGVLEMVPSEIERLRIPIVRASRAQFRDLDAAVRARASADEVLELVDGATLGAFGLSLGEMRTMRGAWRRLRDRRLRV